MSNYDELLGFLSCFSTGGESGYMAFTRANRAQDELGNKKWGDFRNWTASVGNGDIDLPIETLSENSDWEYYFTPAVLDEPSRLQSNFKYAKAIWLDFDEPVDWRQFNPAPSIVVQTSPTPKVHCYWLLEEPITDVNDMRYWLTRFMEYFTDGDGEADPAIKDASRLMKLPWGANLKLKAKQDDGSAFRPKILKFNPDLLYSELAFDHLPEPQNVPLVADLNGIGDIPVIEKTWTQYAVEYDVPNNLMAKLMEVQSTNEDGRSGGLYHLICELHEEVAQDPEKVFQVLFRSPNDKFTADQGDSRGGALLWKDINRVIRKAEVNAANSGSPDIVNNIMNGSGTMREKAAQITDHVLDELSRVGTFIQTTTEECYFVDSRTGHAKMYLITKDFGTRFTGLVCTRFGLNGGVDRNLILGILYASIVQCQLKDKVHFNHFSYYDMHRGRIYVDRYDGSMYILDGETVTKSPYGKDDVYFHSSEGSKYPASFDYTTDYRPGGLDSVVLDSPNYATAGHGISRRELRHILKTWVSTFFFGEIMDTKPIVLIHGPADSGKTTMFQSLSILLSGDSTESVTSMPQKGPEFETHVTQSAYVFYDNVEVNLREIQEKLAQVATGFTVKRRKLYATNTMLTYKSRAFVGITSRTLDRIQEDVVQRYIIVPVQPFNIGGDQTRTPLSVILREVLDNRNQLWSELLDFVNRLLGAINTHGMPNTATKFRMADYGMILELACGQEGLSSRKLEDFIIRMQDDTVSENDPLVMAMQAFYEALPPNEEHRFTSSQLYRDLTKINRKVASKYTSNACTRSMKGYISSGHFKRAGLEVDVTKSGNNTVFILGKERH